MKIRNNILTPQLREYYARILLFREKAIMITVHMSLENNMLRRNASSSQPYIYSCTSYSSIHRDAQIAAKDPRDLYMIPLSRHRVDC